MMTQFHQMLPGPWRWSNTTTTEWWRSATSGESLGSICMPSILHVWSNNDSSFAVGTLQVQKSWRRDATTYPSCPAATPNEGQLRGNERQDQIYPIRCPNLPPVEQNGWEVKDGMYIPVRCLNSPAPRAAIKLIKCGCKSDCNGARCSCLKMLCLAPPVQVLQRGMWQPNPRSAWPWGWWWW